MTQPILMAAFGEDFVETRILSEANAVKYWLRVYATHNNAVPNTAVLTINGEQNGAPTLSTGINVIRVDNGFFTTDSKVFETTNDDSPSNLAFVEYMNSIQRGLYVIMTHGKYNTSPVIDNWFKSKFSVQWAGSGFAKSFPNSAYGGLYKASKSRIVTESFSANDGKLKEDSRAKFDTVFDDVGAVGYTGYTYRAIEDTNEYSDSTGYEYKRYPEQNNIISKLSNYGLSGSDNAFFIADMFASKALLDAGSTTRANLRWFKGTSMISSVSLEVPKNGVDRWLRFERYVQVPPTADGFTIVISRYPKPTIEAESKIKNVMFVQTSGNEILNDVVQEFGVNGIRMNKGIEGKTTMIMELPNAKLDPSGIIPVSSFRETSD